MNEAELRALARAHGYARMGLCTPEPFERWRAASACAHKTARHLHANPLEDVPWARALCVLAAPYPMYKPIGGVSVCAYYVAYNAAHARMQALIESLHERGVEAQEARIPLKPAALRAHLGAYGRNGLIQLEGLGSCVMLGCVALGEGFELECADAHAACIDASAARQPEYNRQPMQGVSLPQDRHICGSCRRCIDACPTGALSEQGLDHARCLRSHMLQGPPVPDELRAAMGGRLLGCEECLRACPRNAGAVSSSLDAPVELRRVLDISRALGEHTRADYMRDFGALLGWNMAIPNRVLAQIVLVAANLGMHELAPLIAPLTKSNSAAVKEHALWALEKLKGINNV